MTDLASLTADQLAETVRDALGGSDYAPTDRRWEDVAADAEAALAELQTRANQLAAAKNEAENSHYWYEEARQRAEAAEKERDEWRLSASDKGLPLPSETIQRRLAEAEARLAETHKALEQAKEDADRLFNSPQDETRRRRLRRTLAALTTHHTADD